MADGEQEQGQQSAEMSREEFQVLESRVSKLEQRALAANVKTAASPLRLEAAIRAAFKHIGVDFGKFLG